MQSASSYVVPSQWYSVHPTGLDTFYPGPTSEAFTPAYVTGTPNYAGQAMYIPSPSMIVPPLQQPPPAKREKKTIFVQDPDQHSMDGKEEIMSGVGRIQNPTLSMGPLSSISTYPQYHQSVPPYVVPPQQYSDHPPGLSTFYPIPTPGEFPPRTPNYTGQAMYTPYPSIIVPPVQPLAPAKRSNKTVFVRDYDQDSMDSKEEIMSEVVMSQNPTPLVGQPSSISTPPQLCPTMLATDDKTKLDRYVIKYAALNATKKLTSLAEPSPATPEPEKPEPEHKKKAINGMAETDITPFHDDSEWPPASQSFINSTSILKTYSLDSRAPPFRENVSSGTMTPSLPNPIVAAAVSAVPTHSPGLSHPRQAPLGISPARKASTGPELKNAGKESVVALEEKVEPTLQSNLSSHQDAYRVSKTWKKPKEEVLVEQTQCPDRKLTIDDKLYLEQKQLKKACNGGAGAKACESVKLEAVPASTTDKLALLEKELEKRSKSIIIEFLHLYDYKEAIQCVDELEQATMLYVFVRVGVETTLERSQITRYHMGQLFHQLLQTGSLSKSQFFKGQREVGVLWRDSGLSWTDFLPETEDVHSFITEQKLEFTLSDPLDLVSTRTLSPKKLNKPLEELEEVASNEQIFKWVKDKPKPAVEATVKNSSVLSVTRDSNTIQRPVLKDGSRQYSRNFLLSLQYVPASVQKPKGLAPISNVVLDKINQKRLSLRLDPQGLISTAPDFTPDFVVFNRQSPAKRGAPKLFRTVRSILNKLTPEMFIQLLKQMKELTIDTEERLTGVVDIVFEKAIDEPNFSVLYGNMCRCLAKLKVPMAVQSNSFVTFRRLLLDRCQEKFLNSKTKDEVVERKKRELEAATSASECKRLQEELEEEKSKACRRSIGNIKLIAELFKLRLLTERIIHGCVIKLITDLDEESLEWLCILFTTIGKELEKFKTQMDMYFKQLEIIMREMKTSKRVQFMLQDIIELRLNNWVSRRAELGPKTLEQIRMDAIFEEQEEQRKVHQQLFNEKRWPGFLIPEAGICSISTLTVLILQPHDGLQQELYQPKQPGCNAAFGFGH
ncbi:eukaryotic translation initiation factor 4 gamma 3 isoform X8 [Silurus meridionalis]|nr:eukaryotic translation initiation factor 4 gamma 3 isoform X8 [Silurus meridionalis]